MDPFWVRLMKCEQRCEYFIRLIRLLKQQVVDLQRQINELQGVQQ